MLPPPAYQLHACLHRLALGGARVLERNPAPSTMLYCEHANVWAVFTLQRTRDIAAPRACASLDEHARMRIVRGAFAWAGKACCKTRSGDMHLGKGAVSSGGVAWDEGGQHRGPRAERASFQAHWGAPKPGPINQRRLWAKGYLGA